MNPKWNELEKAIQNYTGIILHESDSTNIDEYKIFINDISISFIATYEEDYYNYDVKIILNGKSTSIMKYFSSTFGEDIIPDIIKSLAMKWDKEQEAKELEIIEGFLFG